MFSTKNLESYLARATSVLQLKFVRSQDDVLDDSLTFAPQFTHQVFGEKETIFGYKNPIIKLFYTPDTLQTYLALSYDKRIDPSKHDGAKADNVIKILSEFIPSGYSTNLDEYLVRISRPHDFKPFGELLHVYSREGASYQVYKADMTCPGFKNYYEKLQMFLLWFIDAASFIDVDDEKWLYYLIYEKQQINGQLFYSIVGYTTVYRFYAYPDKIRPRLSQMLILPPFQRKCHGAELLQSIYNDLVPCPEVLDVTVEDPSDNFIFLRDFVDCRNAIKLYNSKRSDIHRPYAESAEEEFRTKLKLQKKQALRVYEIVRLYFTDRTNPEQYRDYRLLVKSRLNGPYKREQRDLKRLEKIMESSELSQTHAQMSHEDHVKHLQEAYVEVEEEYMKIIEKILVTSET